MKRVRYYQLSVIVAILACSLLLPSHYGKQIVIGGDFLPNSSLLIRTLTFSAYQNYLNPQLLFSYFCLAIICVSFWMRFGRGQYTATKGNTLTITCLIITVFCAVQVQEVQKLQGGFPLTRDYDDDLASLVKNNDEGEKLTRKWSGILNIKSLVGAGRLYSSNSVLNVELAGIGMLEVIRATNLSDEIGCKENRSEFEFLGYIQERRILFKTSGLVSPKYFSLFICDSEILIY